MPTLTINRKTFKSVDDFVKRGRGCATANPNRVQIARVDEELAASRRIGNRPARITIRIQFFHLTYGQQGQIHRNQCDAQVKVLNAAYNRHGITFTCDPKMVRYVDNHAWFFMGHRSVAERAAKTAFHVNPETTLNFYTAGLQPGLLGWATFPFDLAGDPMMDGVVILHTTLPGGTEAPFNLGKTAVHEVGHWLGLYHTFQGGCDAFGDHVGDTPAHSGPNYGKPKDGQRHNVCNPKEFAPIHNYMNYVDDAWMRKFTKKQAARIKEQVAMNRPGLLLAT